MSDEPTMEIKKLDFLLWWCRQEQPVARVGILGDEAKRVKGGPTNAEIGAAHEYGAPARGLPQRSFLRVPIADNLEKRMESSGALSPNEIDEVMKKGDAVPWVKKIAVLAEGIVKEAFQTGGFDKWPAWKNPSYSNNSGQLLVDTTQLRDSITSEVKE